MEQAFKEIRSDLRHSNMWIQQQFPKLQLPWSSTCVHVCIRCQVQQEKVIQLAQGKSEGTQQQRHSQPHLQDRTLEDKYLVFGERALIPAQLHSDVPLATSLVEAQGTMLSTHPTGEALWVLSYHKQMGTIGREKFKFVRDGFFSRC